MANATLSYTVEAIENLFGLMANADPIVHSPRSRSYSSSGFARPAATSAMPRSREARPAASRGGPHLHLERCANPPATYVRVPPGRPVTGLRVHGVLRVSSCRVPSNFHDIARLAVTTCTRLFGVIPEHADRVERERGGPWTQLERFGGNIVTTIQAASKCRISSSCPTPFGWQAHPDVPNGELRLRSRRSYATTRYAAGGRNRATKSVPKAGIRRSRGQDRSAESRARASDRKPSKRTIASVDCARRLLP